MKRFVMWVAAFFIVAAMSVGYAKEADAQSISSVVYDFSSYQIPVGAQARYEVSQGAMVNMLQKNADGTFATDGSGNFVADPAAVDSFVTGLAGIYNIPGTTVLNTALEKQYLITLISQGRSDPYHVPSVTTMPKQTAADPSASEGSATADLMAGKTFIDVNITTQKLTYYINGTPTLVSDIVTGNSSAGHNTPTGTYQIYNKQKNRVLKGDGYAAHVNFWMPFVGNYGIHDANWRGSFGGSIYKRNGSHGCVNMPNSMASTLFATAPVGTPVLVHL